MPHLPPFLRPNPSSHSNPSGRPHLAHNPLFGSPPIRTLSSSLLSRRETALWETLNVLVNRKMKMLVRHYRRHLSSINSNSIRCRFWFPLHRRACYNGCLPPWPVSEQLTEQSSTFIFVHRGVQLTSFTKSVSAYWEQRWMIMVATSVIMREEDRQNSYILLV